MCGVRGEFIAKLRQIKGFQHVRDLGGCSLHHVHNVVKADVKAAFGEDVETFPKDFRYSKGPFINHVLLKCMIFDPPPSR